MPWKTWVVGEEVLAADFNDYIQEQVVATFVNSAARAAAISSPVEGQVTYLTATDSLEVYDGAAWSRPKNVAWGHISGPTQFTTDAALAAGTQVVPGSSFTLPYAGRRYAIHTSATVEALSYASASQTVTFGIVFPTTAGTVIDYQIQSGGSASAGDYLGFHCYASVVPASDGQAGHCAVNPAGTTAVLRNGRVWVADIGI